MPVSDQILQQRQARFDQREATARRLIPSGPYCYAHTGRMRNRDVAPGSVALPELQPCPFYKLRADKPAQQNGYCRHLKVGDFSAKPHKTSLLWDAVKECGINIEIDDLDGELSRPTQSNAVS